MSEKFTGKVAIVTGAGSGMGRCITQEFIRQGANVVAIDINEGSLNTLARECDKNGKILTIAGDISCSKTVESFGQKSFETFGTVDILVNCAGILDDYKSITDTDEQLWDKIISVNLKGAYLLSRVVLPKMVEQGSGAIINVGSIAGFVAGGGGASYTAAKHGLIGLTKQTSFDYGRHGIRANCICPGAVETAMTREILTADNLEVMKMVRSVPAGRHGQPEEIAELVLFLASSKAEFIHGAAIPIDGGWIVK